MVRPSQSAVRYAGGAAPPVDSPEFWRRAERWEVSKDPDVATAEVVQRMAELARASASDPVFVDCAARAVEQFRGGPIWFAAGIDPFNDAAGDGRRELALAESAWWWAKVYLKFVHHNRLIWDRLRERDQWQLLISPDVLVRMWPMRGDCAVYSSLIAAMLQVLGVPWELQTVAVDAEQPSVYSHVFVRAILPNGRRVSLDASHGDVPGWHVPAHDVFRSQVWNSQGRPVPDAAPAFNGLSGYEWRGRRRRGGLRGLGDMCTPGDWDYSPDLCAQGQPGSGSGSGPVGPNPTQVFLPPGSVPAFPPSVYTNVGMTPPGSSSSAWQGELASLLNQWTQIGGRVLAPTVSVTRGPNGQLVYSAPAGSAASTAIPGLGVSASPLLLYGGAAVVLLLIVSMAGKK